MVKEIRSVFSCFLCTRDILKSMQNILILIKHNAVVNLIVIKALGLFIYLSIYYVSIPAYAFRRCPTLMPQRDRNSVSTRHTSSTNIWYHFPT